MAVFGLVVSQVLVVVETRDVEVRDETQEKANEPREQEFNPEDY